MVAGSSPGRADVIHRLGSVTNWDEVTKVFFGGDRAVEDSWRHREAASIAPMGRNAVWLTGSLTVPLAALILAALVLALFLTGPNKHVFQLFSPLSLTGGVQVHQDPLAASGFVESDPKWCSWSTTTR